MRGSRFLSANFFVLFILILGLIHIFYSIRKSFNKLEDSVIQMAKGNFDVEI